MLNELKRANIKGLKFWQKKDIPVQYHIKNNARTAPILLVTEKGYFLRGFPESGKTKPVWDVIYTGHHGYDPYLTKEMRTIMYARGPGLKKNFTSQPLMMTDHYNLLCNLLDIESQPNNGSWSRVKSMLSTKVNSVDPVNIRIRRSSSSSNLITINLNSFILLIVLTFNFSFAS